MASSALVGVDGNYTVTAGGEVLNNYTALSANAAAGATSISVANRNSLNSTLFGNLAAGDLLMIIQMQGATISTVDEVGYGAVTAVNGAGLYELVTVASLGGGGTININTTGCGGLRNNYVAASTQVVRVPQLASLTVNAGASVTAPPWDGAVGGVLALQVQNTLNLNGTLNANATGFRGGAADNAASANGAVAYRTADATLGAEKGEGIAGYQTAYDGLNGRYGRGAAANGGGGGDGHNAGGGGGANGNNGNTWTGQGVMRGTVTGGAAWALDPGYIANGNALTNSGGGGRGGYTYSANNQNALTLAPGQATWGGDSRREVGGLGGRPVANAPATRLFLGGGGGAGDGNNAAAGPGGRGGGLVWVVADTVTGTGSVAANGQAGTDTVPTHNDAPGGGGAGGTVVVAARSLSGIVIDANGGRGGNQLITTAEAEGPGGGGGGGYIAVSGGTVTRNVGGGLGGTTSSTSLTEFPSNGATDGAAGELGAAVVALPLCLPSDLAITVTDGVTSVVPGTTVTYSLTVTNNGPNAVTGAAVTDVFPAALTGVSWTCAPAAACGSVSGTGDLNGALLTLASGGTATFTVTATVDPSATGSLVNTASVAVPLGHTDPTAGNNSATDTDTLTPRADQSLTLTDAPDPVNGGAALTYTLNVNNAGPSTAASVTATLNLPTGAGFVSATGTGWTCGHAGDVVTCTGTAVTPGAAPAITVQVTAPTAAGAATAAASVSATTTDPVPGNNSASQTTTVVVVNSPPDAVNDTVTVAEDSGATPVNVLANDTTAPDTGETLTVQSVTQPAEGGTVTLAGGVVSFTPAANYNGPVTFTYTVSDGNGGTDTATVTVTVTAVNDPPTGVADMYTVSNTSGATTLSVLDNDSSAPDGGETLTVSAVTQPASGGTVTIAPGGTGVVFTPAPGAVGLVTFTYTVSDGNGGTTVVTVTVNVLSSGNPPDAVNDTLMVAEDSGPTPVDVLANDSTAPDTGETLTVTAVTQPANGTVTLAGGVVTFTPAPNFNGTATFTYTVSDGNGGTDMATVTVTVSAVNDPPTGVADSFSVPAGSGPTTLDVLANDSSAPDSGETLVVSAVTQPTSGGTVTVAPGGTGVVFTPEPGFSGPVTFTYTVSDGNGGTAIVTVTVNVGLVDSDDDGVPDDVEDDLGLDPADNDSDNDGVPDDEDGLTDTDGDGTIDALDADSDNDGLNDGLERGVTAENAPAGTDTSSPNFQPDLDPSTTTDPRNPDSDGDGLKDGTEDENHDGRVGNTESDPNDADTDDGGESDGAEAEWGGNPRDYADDIAVAGRGCASTGTGTLLPLALLLLGLPLLRRRRASRGAVGAYSLLGLLALVLVAVPASAQGVAPGSQGIDVQQYKPGPGLRDVLGLHSAQVGRHLNWNVGLSFNYAKDPLNFLNPRTDTFTYEIIKNQFTFDLMGAVALYERFELGVGLPITSQGSGSGLASAPGFAGGVDATGVGDLRLVPKATLLTTEGGLNLGLALPLILPTSGGKDFLGRSGVAAAPRIIGEWVSEGGTRVLANVGFNFQPKEQLYNLNVGNEFAYGIGTEVPFQLGHHRLAAEASLLGALGLKQTNAEERPLELLGALKYHFSDAVAAHLGGGPGLTRGYGTPGFRMFAGVIWTQAERVIPTRVEPPPLPVCPRGPEDVDGFEDGDGCADPDNDGDGLRDEQDRCPNEPETKNSFEDEDGCPDELPPPPPVDTDGDGLTDDEDRCPGEAEDLDGFQDTDGCADTDNDKDSVADTADKCPAEPETINGVDDADGCPDKGKVKVLVEGEKIVILDKVYFATGKDVILARSFSLLRQVAAVLRANPHITRVRVEGHTDNQGADAANQALSQRRADSVRKRLIEQEGIAPERLEAVGYGETKPVDKNETAKGRENNRRVEFLILETKPIEVEKEAP
ncbi:MAG TPA: Ig-like domain-containing protein [Myxococcaceae bacterium]|nr:Ig-like domain-containing protein [Myxococcaceae bacterium]